MKSFLTSFSLAIACALQVHAEDTAKTADVSTTALPSVKCCMAANAWPHEMSDLKPDANAVFGKLDNGLRYVIMPTKAAPTRASLRLYMNVGCGMETDEQLGIAHFIEHLAFCGTKHFPNGEMIEYFQRLGMKFVADTNARTEFGKTVYVLELPRASEEVTGEAMKLFRDFLDGMLLDAKEIERERGVILSEIRASDSGDYREDLAEMHFLAPDAMVSKRVPLGSIASVRSLKRQQFVDFYETWYTPGRATIVAAGDFDAKMVERLIVRSFADAKARRGERADPSLGIVKPAAEITAASFSDADLQTITVSLHAMRPAKDEVQTTSNLRADVVREMAYSMLTTRLGKIAATDGNAILSALATCNLAMKGAEDHNVTVSVRGQQWKGAIGIVEQELRRCWLTDLAMPSLKKSKQS